MSDTKIVKTKWMFDSVLAGNSTRTQCILPNMSSRASMRVMCGGVVCYDDDGALDVDEIAFSMSLQA